MSALTTAPPYVLHRRTATLSYSTKPNPLNTLTSAVWLILLNMSSCVEVVSVYTVTSAVPTHDINAISIGVETSDVQSSTRLIVHWSSAIITAAVVVAAVVSTVISAVISAIVTAVHDYLRIGCWSVKRQEARPPDWSWQPFDRTTQIYS